MKKLKLSFVLSALFLFFAPAQTWPAIIDWGGDYFFDDQSQMYWFDPVYWQGESEASINLWLQSNTQWNMASTKQVWTLFSPIGDLVAGDPVNDIRNVIGNSTQAPPQHNFTAWMGVTTDVRLKRDDYGHFGFVYGNATVPVVPLIIRGNGTTPVMDRGAWMYTQTDPMVAPIPEPATLLLLGAGLAGLVGCRKKFKKD